MRTSERRRRKLAVRGRTSEAGLTLIELLISLAVLSILVAFIAGALLMARRTFNADGQSELASETDSGIEAVASLVASAMRLPAAKGLRRAGITFDGTKEKLAFVGLSEGRSLRGGLQPITVGLRGSDLVVDLGGPAAAPNDGTGAETVVVRGVRRLRFGYFGAMDAAQVRRWQSEWVSAERLPELVSIQLEFEDVRRNRPSRVFALHQG